jgi:hypothetical protein
MEFRMYQPGEHPRSQGRDDPADEAAGMIGEPRPSTWSEAGVCMPEILQARTPNWYLTELDLKTLLESKKTQQPLVRKNARS